MNDKELGNIIFGVIISAGFIIMILIAILQTLTIIFFVLTVISILATLFFIIIGFASDEWERGDYFLYAGVAFLCIILFFSAGRATYSASEALQNNPSTKGLMEITSAFFFIQVEKQKAINQIETAQIDAVNNITSTLSS
jgi:hypothetical protein